MIILNGEATVFDPIADVVLHAGISETLPRIVLAVARGMASFRSSFGPPRPRSEVDIVGGAQLLDGATSCLMFGSLMSTTRVRSPDRSTSPGTLETVIEQRVPDRDQPMVVMCAGGAGRPLPFRP